MAEKKKTAGASGNTRRLNVNATITVKFVANIPAGQSNEDTARELEVLVRGVASTAPITNIDVTEPGSTPNGASVTGKRAYMAGITEKGSDDWAFQGIVVAKDKDEAKKVLAEYKRSKYPNEGRCEVAFPFMEDRGIPTNKKVGVYDSTNFNEFELT